MRSARNSNSANSARITPDYGAFVAAAHPAGKFPVLVDGDTHDRRSDLDRRISRARNIPART